MIKDDFVGPLDEAPWPKKLAARVVEGGETTRVQGYALDTDLAANYTFSEIVLLSLAGEIPTAQKARAFEVACAFFSRTSAAESPIHAALLARVCNATTSAVTGVSAIALGEQARFDLARFEALLTWLAKPASDPPAEFLAHNPSELRRTQALRTALLQRNAFLPEALAFDLEPDAATVAVLHACGLVTLASIESVRVFARFPFVMAEALAAPPAKYKDYPVTLPPIRYEEEAQ